MDEGRAAGDGCRVGLLGPTYVGPGRLRVERAQPKHRELLTVLALEPSAAVAHEAIAEALWDGRPPRTWSHSVQLYVSALRRTLADIGSDVEITTVTGGYRLEVELEAVDAHLFRRLVARGVAPAPGDDAAIAALEAALDLWRGAPLGDVASRDFARREAARLLDLRSDALEALAGARLAGDDPQRALAAAQEVVAADGLRERAVAHLMLASYRLGRPAEALRAFEDLRRRLDEDLGAVPSSELRELHARVLRHDALGGDRFEIVARARRSGGEPSATTPPVPRQDPPPRRPRRRRLGVALAAAAAVATGAAAGIAAWGPTNVPEQGPPGVPSAPAVLVFHGDGEVNMLVEAGFDRAVSELGLISREVVTGDADAASTVADHAVEGGLVVDFTIETDTAAIAAHHPGARFVMLDDQETQDAGTVPNLATVRFAVQEPSYLAGIAAALTSRTGRVAFVGGVDYATIWPFEAGFVAGARAADPTVEVEVRYLARPPDYGAGFLDARAGERVARRLYEDGVDVVFAAAGTSGLGVFEAATSLADEGRPLWAIGVDSDQYETVATLPGTVDVAGWRRHILTSVVLRFDRAVYGQVRRWATGDFRAGLHRYDLGNEGVELSYSGGHLDGLRPTLESARAAIAAGEVSVPCRPSRLSPAEGSEPIRC